jgi:hypothetical protein
MRAAHTCASAAELLERAKMFAEVSLSPLPEPVTADEVQSAAAYAWRKTERDENWVGRGGVVPVETDHFNRYFYDDPDAHRLVSALKWHHGGSREPFFIAKGMATKLGWGLPRFYRARQRLLNDGVIVCVHPGGRRPADPPVYGWGRPPR